MNVHAVPAIAVPGLGHRKTLIAACVGNVVEWYDFALFAGSATVLAAVLAPGGWAGFTTVFAVFATSCLFRPLGSLFIGARADRTGRRSVLAATILLMAVATFAIGLLPPWSAIGVLAPLCLLGLRAAQAFSAGGEIGVSVAYLSEYSPPGRRGRNGGWYLGTAAFGIAAGIGATALLAAVLDPAEFQAWGWRIPFLIALPLGVVGVYLRLRLAESPLFVQLTTNDRISPVAVLRANFPAVRRCFLLAGAYSAAFNVWFLFLPSYVTATGVSSLVMTLTCALAGLVVLGCCAPIFGRFSDRVGRRPLLIAATAMLAVAIIPLYLWTLGGSLTALLTGDLFIGMLLSAFVLPAFFAEQFATGVRATGIGLAYGVGSAVVGGTAPLIATVLARQAPVYVVPGYLALWAIAGLLAVYRSPETVTRPPAARQATG
jgi:MHS family proline/betaine transporter-like MFS transporter